MIDACLAVAAGLATHVLCFRSVYEGSAQGKQGRSAVMPGGGGGGRQKLPRRRVHGVERCRSRAPSATTWIAMFAQRHFYEFGTTREQLAQIALNARKNAALNPKAIYRDPMTMDDYLDVAHDLDAAVPVRLRRAVRRRHRGHRVARRHGRRPAQAADPRRGGRDRAATAGRRGTSSTTSRRWRAATPRAQLWTRTDIKPSDVQLAEMYDGFSFITMCVARGHGVLRPGRVGPVRRGRAAHRDASGELPLNTHGGQLSAGRLHGYGFLHEACVQLWGEAGERQVPGDPEVGVAAAGGGPLAGCLLLTNRH